MIAIDAKNLSKSFRLYKSPSQRLKEIVLRKPFHTIFAALDNITFSIGEGETFGIIGENGAGKSTLLKILARTLKPTSGNLTINGRTAALLELGAGFNPDLTGEDNIFLNAYLMGLSKKEIEGKKKEKEEEKKEEEGRKEKRREKRGKKRSKRKKNGVK